MRLKAQDIIAGSVVPGKPGIYVLGCYDDRITFFSQQVRAINLIWALSDQGYLAEASRVAIIGGGAAGTTAAACVAIAQDKIDVELFESRSELLQLQSVSSKRSLDPHIYSWPEKGSVNSNAGLPILDWAANSAQQVRSSILQELSYIKGAVGNRLNVQVNRKVVSLTEASKGYQIVSEAIDGSQSSGQYDVVILAFGFGTEPGSVGATQVPSYWSDTGIPEQDLSGDSNPTFIISGSGDGALIDLVAAATKSFDHADMIRQIRSWPGIDVVGRELEAIDSEAQKCKIAHSPFDLKAQYDSRILPKLRDIGVLSRVESNVRPTLHLILQTRSQAIFNLQTSILNRLAAYLVVMIYSAKSSFDHLSADDLLPSAPEPGESPLRLWFVCNGTRISANKAFFRRGTDKPSVRAPFATLLEQYPAAHKLWLDKHGQTVMIPRLLDSANDFFKGLARRYSVPRPQYLETAYPMQDISIQVELDGSVARWAGDVTPDSVARLWDGDNLNAKLYCPDSPDALGALALAISRIVIHTSTVSLHCDRSRWDTLVSGHTKDSDMADDIPLPRLFAIGTIGTQYGLEQSQPDLLTNRLHAAMDRWVLDGLKRDVAAYLKTAEDPSRTIGFEIEANLRGEMDALWQEWDALLSASSDRLSRFLRLIVCAQEDRAISGGSAAIMVGPRRYKQILKTTVAALAVGCVWEHMSPADSIPGNLTRQSGTDQRKSGFACAADRIDKKAVMEVCLGFDWATDFVLLPLQMGSLLVEEFAQTGLDRTGDGQPLMNEISVPARILISADQTFNAALRKGRVQLQELLQKKENETYKRLKLDIEERV